MSGWPSDTARGSDYVSGGSRNHKAFVREAVRGRREDARKFLAAGLAFLRAGSEAGVSKDYLSDQAKGLHDAVSDLVGGLRKDLDNERLDPDAGDIDLTELNAILGG